MQFKQVLFAECVLRWVLRWAAADAETLYSEVQNGSGYEKAKTLDSFVEVGLLQG